MLNGYELRDRGKLGVPLRFLSRTAQPPQQSSPKEAMALNASHFFAKDQCKSHKTERRRSSESRQPWRRRRGQMANVLAGRRQTCVLPARNVTIGTALLQRGRTRTGGN